MGNKHKKMKVLFFIFQKNLQSKEDTRQIKNNNSQGSLSLEKIVINFGSKIRQVQFQKFPVQQNSYWKLLN